MNFLIQRARARAFYREEERVYRPALMRLCKAFGGGDTLGEFLWANLTRPSFGAGVTLGNRWKADTEVVCKACGDVFPPYHLACRKCGEVDDLGYRKVRR